jgi:hypothetical protein
MPIRTTEANVTFKHPFSLPDFECPQPAGTYRVVTDEEEIPGLSFLAFRRVATMLRLPSVADHGRPEEVIFIDPNELSAALAADEKRK